MLAFAAGPRLAKTENELLARVPRSPKLKDVPVAQARKLTSTPVLSSALALGLCLAFVGCSSEGAAPSVSQPAPEQSGEGSLTAAA